MMMVITRVLIRGLNDSVRDCNGAHAQGQKEKRLVDQ